MKIDKTAYGEDYNKERNDKIVKIASVAICLLQQSGGHPNG